MSPCGFTRQGSAADFGHDWICNVIIFINVAQSNLPGIPQMSALRYIRTRAQVRGAKVIIF